MKTNVIKNIGALIFIGLFITTFLLFFKPFGSSKKDECAITVGMMSGWAPFMTINQQGKFEGFDVDVANEVAKRLGKKCQITDVGSLSSLFVALEKGKVDMLFSGLDITTKRLTAMEMVPYTGQGFKEFYLLFWNKIPEGITSIQDLKNYPNATVIAEPGDSPEKYLAQFDFITKKSIGALADQLLDLQYGKSLALFREPQLAKRLCKKNPQLKALSVPLPVEWQAFGMGIALKKGNTKLNSQVQATIQAMKADGTLKALETKWQMNEEDNES